MIANKLIQLLEVAASRWKQPTTDNSAVKLPEVDLYDVWLSSIGFTVGVRSKNPSLSSRAILFYTTCKQISHTDTRLDFTTIGDARVESIDKINTDRKNLIIQNAANIKLGSGKSILANSNSLYDIILHIDEIIKDIMSSSLCNHRSIKI